MRYLTCREADDWNVRLHEADLGDLQAAAAAISSEIGGMSTFPFTYHGTDYTIFYDDEVFMKGKDKIVVSLYIQGNADLSYLDPEGPDLVFGNFAIVKGHAHEGMFTSLSDEAVQQVSNFIIESDSKLKAMKKSKLFQKNEVIRPQVVKHTRTMQN